MHNQTSPGIGMVHGVVGTDHTFRLMAIAANLWVWAVFLPAQTAMAL